MIAPRLVPLPPGWERGRVRGEFRILVIGICLGFGACNLELILGQPTI